MLAWFCVSQQLVHAWSSAPTPPNPLVLRYARSHTHSLDSLEADWREVLAKIGPHERARALFAEAFDVFRTADEETRATAGADGIKQRRQLHQYLLEALSFKLLTRRDLEHIDEEIAMGVRTVRCTNLTLSQALWVEFIRALFDECENGAD